jgi:hypothetical protein
MASELWNRERESTFLDRVRKVKLDRLCTEAGSVAAAGLGAQRATVPSAAATEMRRHLDEIERTLDRTAPRAAHALRDVFAGYRHAR